MNVSLFVYFFVTFSRLNRCTEVVDVLYTDREELGDANRLWFFNKKLKGSDWIRGQKLVNNIHNRYDNTLATDLIND